MTEKEKAMILAILQSLVNAATTTAKTKEAKSEAAEAEYNYEIFRKYVKGEL